MSQVIIGMDPHKRSATIEVMTSDEAVLGGSGRHDAAPRGQDRMWGGDHSDEDFPAMNR